MRQLVSIQVHIRVPNTIISFTISLDNTVFIHLDVETISLAIIRQSHFEALALYMSRSTATFQRVCSDSIVIVCRCPIDSTILRNLQVFRLTRRRNHSTVVDVVVCAYSTIVIVSIDTEDVTIRSYPIYRIDTDLFVHFVHNLEVHGNVCSAVVVDTSRNLLQECSHIVDSESLNNIFLHDFAVFFLDFTVYNHSSIQRECCVFLTVVS